MRELNLITNNFAIADLGSSQNGLDKVEDSLTKSYKHKEYSMFKSLSLTPPNHHHYNNNHNFGYQSKFNTFNYNKQFNNNYNQRPQQQQSGYLNQNRNHNYPFSHLNMQDSSGGGGGGPQTAVPLYLSKRNPLKSSKSSQPPNSFYQKKFTNNQMNNSANISSTSSLSSSSASSLNQSGSNQFQKNRLFSNSNSTTTAALIHHHNHTADEFNLKPAQFNLIKLYFDKLQQYSYLKVKLVKAHILNSIVNNPNRANLINPPTNEDVDRTLNLIDSNKSGLFTFANFCDYLNLFLANKSNLKAKLKTIIQAKRCFFNIEQNDHPESEHLTLEEMEQTISFLNQFYQANLEFSPESKTTDQFIDHIVTNLALNLFVRKN